MSCDDFLWDCALQSVDNSRLDIVPDYEDDMRHFCVDNERNANIGATFQLLPLCKHTVQHEIDVCITESRGNGVLDIIGGELWEGALLLCVYILQHQPVFLRPEVLELGSGVGLPGLLLAQLKTNSIELRKGDVGSITLTDNDPRVVRNLNSSVVSLPSCHAKPIEWPQETNKPATLHTRLLDWSIFSSIADRGVAGSAVELTLPGVAQEVSDICEVILGCELCYAPYHAQCLAQLLRYYLSKGYCQKVVICQMRDREGFQQLLITLKEMKIEFAIQEITEQQYDLAQRIQCRKATLTSAATTTGTKNKSSADSYSTTHATDSQSNYYTHRKAPTTDEEDDDIVSKTFTFPVELLNDASGGSNTIVPDQNTDVVDSPSPYTDHLLHTPKENFVFLIIG